MAGPVVVSHGKCSHDLEACWSFAPQTKKSSYKYIFSYLSRKCTIGCLLLLLVIHIIVIYTCQCVATCDCHLDVFDVKGSTYKIMTLSSSHVLALIHISFCDAQSYDFLIHIKYLRFDRGVAWSCLGPELDTIQKRAECGKPSPTWQCN